MCLDLRKVYKMINIKKPISEYLEFYYQRLVNVYGENELLDYMIIFLEIIERQKYLENFQKDYFKPSKLTEEDIEWLKKQRELDEEEEPSLLRTNIAFNTNATYLKTGEKVNIVKQGAVTYEIIDQKGQFAIVPYEDIKLDD